MFILKLNRETWQRNSYPPVSNHDSKPLQHPSSTPNPRGRKRKSETQTSLDSHGTTKKAFIFPSHDHDQLHASQSINMVSPISPSDDLDLQFLRYDLSSNSQLSPRNPLIDEMKSFINDIINTSSHKRYIYADYPSVSQISAQGNLSYEELCRHVMNLQIEHVQRYIRPILSELMSHPRNCDIFNYPVQAVELGAVDYYEKISQPMDLGTVKTRLATGFYEDKGSIVSDINLVFRNAIIYNPPQHPVHQCAIELATRFQDCLRSAEEKHDKEADRRMQHQCGSCHGKTCGLCGEGCVKHDISDLACHGPCAERIRKHHTYFVADDGSILYCQKCYQNLHSVIQDRTAANPLQPRILKRDLLRRKLEDESSEQWINCSLCQQQYHEACALVNSRLLSANPKHHDHDHNAKSKFVCPFCMLQQERQRWKVRQTSIPDDTGSEQHTPFDSSKMLDDSYPQASLAADVVVIEDSEEEIYSHDSPRSPTALSTSKVNADITTATALSLPSMSNNICDDPAIRDVLLESQSFDFVLQPHHLVEVTSSVKAIDLTATINKPSSYSSDARSDSVYRAHNLPASRLASFLQEFVTYRLSSCGFDASVTESLTIRVVSNIECSVEVPSCISSNLSTIQSMELPSSLPYRQKCILLFQRIDGVDVCLYCLYVQEFNASCPPPNTSTAYIAYLDSVDYFRPPEARTIVYHEILVGYMQWIQHRGFQRCHIWSCPPRKGDNFIFWRHPFYQKTPQRDRLNRWYEEMLGRCHQMDIISNTTNLFEQYFQPYLKKDRDEVNQRQAAKQSFVGSGRIIATASAATKAYFAAGKNSSSSGSSTSSSTGFVDPTNQSRSNICPVFSPPIFEGDYWVDQYRKVHVSISQRISSSTYQLDDINGNLRRAKELIKDISSTPPYSSYFVQPVDPVALKIESYFSIISNPMDLGTIKHKLFTYQYHHLADLAADVQLTFANAMKFNQSPMHPVHIAAKHLLNSFQHHLQQLVSKYYPNLDDVLAATPSMEVLNPYLIRILLFDLQAISSTTEEDEVNHPTSICRAVSWGSCTSFQDDQDYQDASNETKSTSSHDYCSDSLDDHRVHRTDSIASFTSTLSIDHVRPLLSYHPTISSLTSLSENVPYVATPFTKPVIGHRALSQLMFEVAKNVCKDKDALFVVTFRDPSTLTSSPLSTTVAPTPAVDSCSIASIDPQPTASKRGRGRIPRISYKPLKPTLPHQPACDRPSLSSDCQAMLAELTPDTSDPDSLTMRSFFSYRHSFLDLCQCYHYQFDSLRRAKHSSIMLLLHLQQHDEAHMQLRCDICRERLEAVRYHCELCVGYDLCSSCYLNQKQPSHRHPLTPYRLYF